MNDWDEDYVYYQYLTQLEWQRVQEEEEMYEDIDVEGEQLSYDQFGEPEN